MYRFSFSHPAPRGPRWHVGASACRQAASAGTSAAARPWPPVSPPTAVPGIRVRNALLPIGRCVRTSTVLPAGDLHTSTPYVTAGGHVPAHPHCVAVTQASPGGPVDQSAARGINAAPDVTEDVMRPIVGLPGGGPATSGQCPERPVLRHRSGVRRGSALAASVLSALLLAGCGGDNGGQASPGTSSPATVSLEPPPSVEPSPSLEPSPSVEPSASVEPSVPPTSQPADPSDEETVGEQAGAPSPGGTGSDGTGSGGTGSSTDASTTENPGVEEADGDDPGGRPEGLPVGPPEVISVHGGRAWAVYLAVGSPDSDWDMHMLGETESYVRGMFGYVGSGIGSVGCDQGAAEALGFDPDDNRVAVYFDSAARAQEFQAVYDRQDLGSAPVTTYCLD